MKKMISQLVWVFVILTFWGCDLEFKSEVEIAKEMVLNSRQGQGVVVFPGRYQAEFVLNGAVFEPHQSGGDQGELEERQVKLKLKSKDWKDEFIFQVPGPKAIPENGEFALLAHEIGQPYDIAGVNEHKISYSELITDPTHYPYVCDVDTGTIIYGGLQKVKYRERTTVAKIHFQLLSPDSDEVAMDFVGREEQMERIYHEFRPCHDDH